MIKRPDKSNPQMSQTPVWSAAELRRVARVYELLIKVDQRKKVMKEQEDNERSKEPKTNSPV
jgi:hypothetical protein